MFNLVGTFTIYAPFVKGINIPFIILIAPK